MEPAPSEIFKALSVETRVKIIELIKNRGPLGAKDIAATIGITTAAVSQHLKILKQAGLVSSQRKGYWIPYSIDEKAMEHCRRVLNDVCTCGCREEEKIRKLDADLSSLASLKQYEANLRKELHSVRQKVKKLEGGE